MADTSCHPQLWRRTSHGVDALVPTELELLVETALHLGKAKINDARNDDFPNVDSKSQKKHGGIHSEM